MKLELGRGLAGNMTTITVATVIACMVVAWGIPWWAAKAGSILIVVWALLQPPLNSEHKFDQGRPLYEWTYFGHGTYETAQACSEDLERFKSPEFNSKFLSSLGSDYRANIDLDDLVCVPSDDPRLIKPK